MVKMRGLRLLAPFLLVATVATPRIGQDPVTPPGGPNIAQKAEAVKLKAAENLYRQLGGVGLDPSRVYHARGVSLDRPAISITLDDGTLAFTQDVSGQVTGAFFEGEGEILLIPPNQVERASMSLQTGAAILEERFITAYFRFNDDTFAEMRPLLSPEAHAQEFVSQWNETARNLAERDALRLLVTFSRSLPVVDQASEKPASVTADSDDRFLHARMQGRTQGIFDVYFDASAPEQVWAGQLRTVDDVSYYDVWCSFSTPRNGAKAVDGEAERTSAVDISDYRIRATITPPTTIEAEALLQMQVKQGGERTVLFELAGSLLLQEVEADGHPVEFIHNPAMEGTQLARRGNDLVAVVFAQPLRTGQRLALRFVYRGEVLSEAGPGLLYVGARGTWYPNRGLAMANFDLEFRYPPGWTLVATGARVGPSADSEAGPESTGEQVSRWVSDHPIPVAGFNLGKYQRVVARAGGVNVETYATRAVERGFPAAKPRVVIADPSGSVSGGPPTVISAPPPPSPARNAQMVANTSAHAIEVFSSRFGPYPYVGLSLTQMPGNMSQGWPGLIFLSSFSFLTPEEKSQLRIAPVERTMMSLVIAHETAHQWWGDLVIWSDYRAQWISEALANYSALMLFEVEDPPQFRAVMDRYRNDLLEKNKTGMLLMEDGPVTLGKRLSCSQFPQGYEAISYGRGSWLIHMLRYMMQDAVRKSGTSGLAISDPAADEPFLRALRRLRERYQERAITTRELLQVFEEELPRPLWYEDRKSLDWFYQGWINGTAVPQFAVRGVKYVDRSGETVVSGVILQKEAPSDLVTPVPLYAVRAGKSVLLGRVFADGSETAFRLSAPIGTRKILVDPNHTLLSRN